MADEEKVQSRLHTQQARRPPSPQLRGLGAGIPAAQAASGAADPMTAARLAAMDPEAARAEAERVQTILSQAQEQATELLSANTAGEISLDGDTLRVVVTVSQGLIGPKNQEEIRQIEQEYAKLTQVRESAVDADLEGRDPAAAEDVDALLSPELDDPYYTPLNDRERRKRIEATLEPIDIEAMVFQGYVEQDVQVHPVVTFRFRSLGTNPSLWLEELIANQKETSAQHLRHWFSLLRVAATLVSVNGQEIQPSLFGIKDKEHFWKALDRRLTAINDQYMDVITDEMIVQSIWFIGRLRKVFLGGGLARRVGNS